MVLRARFSGSIVFVTFQRSRICEEQSTHRFWYIILLPFVHMMRNAGSEDIAPVMIDSRLILCPFCSVQAERIVLRNKYAMAIRDGYPVSPGHSLLIPVRHVTSLVHLKKKEAAALWALLAEARARLDEELNPEGYNIGVNDGRAAGQTVMHLHVHLIPRFEGDRSDPRGGVRWVIPEHADYWSARE